jgi:hypothetical protein
MFHSILLRVTWADLAAFFVLGELVTERDPARFFCYALPLQQSSTNASPDIVVTWSVTTRGILHTHKNTFKPPNPPTALDEGYRLAIVTAFTFWVSLGHAFLLFAILGQSLCLEAARYAGSSQSLFLLSTRVTVWVQATHTRR